MTASLKQRLIGGVIWLSAARTIGQAISWLITIYVVRLLTPDDYGLMGMTMVYTGFVILFSEFGLGTALIQRKGLTSEDVSSIGWAIAAINTLLFAMSWALAPVVADFYGEPKVTELVRASSIVLLTNMIGAVPFNILTREMRFDRRSAADLIATLAGAVTTLLLALSGKGVWSLIIGVITLESLKNFLYFTFSPWSIRFRFDWQRVRQMFNFGTKVAVGRLFWYISHRADIVIAGAVLGKTMLGYYAIAAQLAAIPLDKVVSMISQAAFPAFSELQSDKKRLASAFLRVTYVTAFITFPVFIGIMLIADDAVPLLLTDKWLPVVLPVKVMCAVACLRAVHSIFAPLAYAVGRPDITMFSSMIMAAIMSLAFYVGAQEGLNGLAYSWLAFVILFVIVGAMSIRLVDLRIRDLLASIASPIAASLLMVAAVLIARAYFLHSMSVLSKMLLSIAIGVIVYAGYFTLVDQRIFSEARAFFQERRASRSAESLT